MATSGFFNGKAYSIAANLEGLKYADPETGMFPMMIDAATEARGGWVGVSGTSLSVSTGSKSLVLASGLGFAVGQPVRIARTSAPSTTFMEGIVTAFDPETLAMTVNVTSITGSGTGLTDWTVMVVRSETAMASSPASIAQGGTGASTAAGARTSLSLQRFFSVLGILSIPPGSPSNGDRYLIGAAASGAWLGQEGVATYNSGWTFEVPAEGDFIYDAGTNRTYIWTGSAESVGDGGLWTNAKAKEMLTARPRWVVGAYKENSFTVGNADNGKWWPIANDGDITVVMDSPNAVAAVAGMEWVAECVGASPSGDTITFSISGGGLFRLADGTTASSIVVAGNAYRLIHFVAGKIGTTSTENEWYVWR